MSRSFPVAPDEGPLGPRLGTAALPGTRGGSKPDADGRSNLSLVENGVMRRARVRFDEPSILGLDEVLRIRAKITSICERRPSAPMLSPVGARPSGRPHQGSLSRP